MLPVLPGEHRLAVVEGLEELPETMLTPLMMALLVYMAEVEMVDIRELQVLTAPEEPGATALFASFGRAMSVNFRQPAQQTNKG